jgi:acetylornithine/succinyldiaminopimelate/putrescine aminotransferase
VLRFMPALTVEVEEVDMMIEILAHVLKQQLAQSPVEQSRRSTPSH